MSEFDYFRITPEQFRRNLPRACNWVMEQEQFILRRGVPLTASQRVDARLAGVGHPERVRLLRVERIPMPEHRLLRAALQAMNLNTSPTAGLALRYGIFIRANSWGQRWLVVRELAHTAQYERLGSIRAFLECFLYQCLFIGYPSAPMEQEAVAMAQRICGPSRSLETPHPPLSGPERKSTVKGRRPHR